MAELTGGRGTRTSQHAPQPIGRQRPATASGVLQAGSPGGPKWSPSAAKQASAGEMVAFLDKAARDMAQQAPIFPSSESLPSGVLGPAAKPATSGGSAGQRQRPKSAAQLRASGAPRLTAGAAAQSPRAAGARQLGRMSLYDNGEPERAPHDVPGPKILRDLDKPRMGFPKRPPEQFLKAGEGLSLWQRNKLKEHLKLHPVSIEAPFVPGTGGVRLSLPSGSMPPPPRTSRTPLPASLLRTYYDNGTLDFVAVRWRGSRADALVWARSVTKGPEGSPHTRSYTAWAPEPPAELDVPTWLPIFIDGVREYEEPYRFLAIRGSEELLYKAGDTLHAFADSLVTPFKSLLDTREPTCVAVGLQLMTAAVALDPQLAAEWARNYWQFAQVLNLFRSRGGSLVVDSGYNKREVASCRQRAGDFVTAFEVAGGPLATAAVRRYSPGHDPAVTEDSMARAAAKAAARAREAGRDPLSFKPFTLF